MLTFYGISLYWMSSKSELLWMKSQSKEVLAIVEMIRSVMSSYVKSLFFQCLQG